MYRCSGMCAAEGLAKGFRGTQEPFVDIPEEKISAALSVVLGEIHLSTW